MTIPTQSRNIRVLFRHSVLASVPGMDDTTQIDHVTTLEMQCEPLWQPLEDLFPDELCACFMAMYQSRTEEGLLIHAYKHVDTRRYLFLDEEGGSWRYTGGDRGTYCRIPLGGALEEAFCGWGDLIGYDPQLADHVNRMIGAARADDDDLAA